MDKNSMTKSNKALLAIGGLIVIVILITLIINALNKKNAAPTPEQIITQVPKQTEVVLPPIPSSTDKFRQEVPQGIVVPELGAKIAPADKDKIAVPSIVTPSAPGADSNFRSFDIRGEGGKFLPAQVIVKQNDIVHVNFSAVDKSYDIVFPSYGMRQIAAQGQKKILEFQAVSTGSYTYYCDSCGGPNGPTTGKIIVVP